MESQSDKIRARIRKEQSEKTKKHFREVVGRIKSGNSHYYHDLMKQKEQE
jgi:hypothetical protein